MNDPANTNPRQQWRDTEQGLTFVELIVTMAVLGVALTLTSFSFKALTSRNEVNSSASTLVLALNMARSEAVTRGQTVSICRSSNPTVTDTPATPVPNCTTASGSGWETGFFVFADDDADGVRDANEELIRTFSNFGQTTMVGNTNVENVLSFNADGFLTTVANGTITSTNPTASRTVEIVISNSGRARVNQI